MIKKLIWCHYQKVLIWQHWRLFQSSSNSILSSWWYNSWVIMCKHPIAKWSCWQEKWSPSWYNMSFFVSKHVPKSHWGEVILNPTHLINRLPSRILGLKSPIKILSLFYPNKRTINHLIPKIFGCVLHAYSQPKLRKIGSKRSQMYFFRIFINLKGI